MSLIKSPHDPAPLSLPNSIEAERYLLGCVLVENSSLENLPESFRATMFYEPFHARLFAAMQDRIASRRLVEPIELMTAFADDASFKELGGVTYLANLVSDAPSTIRAAHYAGVIADLSLRRALIRTGREITNGAMDAPEPAIEQLAEVERTLAEFAHVGGAPSNWVSAGDITGAALALAKTQKGLVGLSTGLSGLDDAIGGLRKGQMILVAGRPAMGKSSAALHLAKAVARRGRGVCFYSMEMPPFDLGLRMACDVAHDPLARRYNGMSSSPRYFDAARGRLDDSQLWQLDQAQEDIARWPLLFDDRPGLTISTILANARRQYRKWERAGIEPGCIIIDHISIARAEGSRQGNKVAEVSDISRACAEMAKTLDTPVVALCQLNRAVEQRSNIDKRPGLSDLRWSGDLESDARVVTFLYRPEYYLKQPEDGTDFEAMTEYRDKLEKVRNKLFWLVEKNNNGPTGQVETYCDIACSAIRDKLGEGA